MTTCPWCGTSYLTFQPNCSNCGGTLPAVDEKIESSNHSEILLIPPSAPRPISDRYVWRLLSGDGWWIVSLVFVILGVVFSLVGAGLTIGVITAFVGIPFLFLGIGFLVSGGWVFIGRYQNAQQVVKVLREGQATRGQIIEMHVNYSVSINGRNPWVIQYQFQANGQDYQGKVTTLNQPGPQMQAGKAVYVLYIPTAPQWSSIYPHP